MKAFLLAAGHGTRLRPITDSIPKCLVPIRGEPLLKIWLDLCASFGVDEVLINVHAQQQLIHDFLQGYESPVQVTVSEEKELLGSAGTIREHSTWVGDDECFWIFYADVLNCVNLGRMMHYHQQRRTAATIGVYRVPDPSRCGVVSVDADGSVSNFVEKPARPTSNLVFSGIMLATPEFIQAIPEHHPVDIGSHVLPRLVGRMTAYEIKEYLIDIGTMTNYQAAQTTWPGKGTHAVSSHL